MEELSRISIDVTEGPVSETVDHALEGMASIRMRRYPAGPGIEKCGRYDHARVCRHCDRNVWRTFEEWE